MEYSTAHLDYVARAFLDRYEGVLRGGVGDQDVARPKGSDLHLLHLSEVGRSWRQKDQAGEGKEPLQYHSEDLLVGCAGLNIALLFAIVGSPAGVQIFLGSFPGALAGNEKATAGAAEGLKSLLASHYPGSRISEIGGDGFVSRVAAEVTRGHLGLITGLPTRKAAADLDRTTQIDRVIRAMRGKSWAWVVLADPLTATLTNDLGHAVVNEMRNVENAEQVKPRRGPLAETYLRQLEALQKEYEQGLAYGAWSVSAYYVASERDAFNALGAALCASFGGDKSFPEPIRSIEVSEPGPLGPSLGQILLGTAEPPGDFEYPYSFQTVLSSQRLAGFVHLPRMEVPGFAVREYNTFDVAMPADTTTGPIGLGRVMDLGQTLEQDYRLGLKALNKHALIVGVTGGGKTNTAFHLLRQLWGGGTPFLVLEPAKTEYRALMADEVIGKDLRVFTLGEESVSPFRMNPFEVEPGGSLSAHIDLLKSTFNASFAMWSPLPQVLERCIHDIYRDYGWDPVRGINRRLEDEVSPEVRALAFPTLTDLTAKVEEVVDSLGYEAKVTSDIKAALVTRLESLRIGGKGAMLDTQVSIPIAGLLAKPTVIELEQVGDDDEKAFLMGLLLIRIYEHLRCAASTAEATLRHVVVVEEAHRLLANIPTTSSEEQANTRGKAVEAFVNMLSEVRAYGQGFIVAEQIPSKLAPDVLKNTNIKVVHRTVAGDDREILARSMNMSEEKSLTLATFRPGEAAVFSEGDDRPLLVKVPPAKIDPPPETSTKRGSDQWVSANMTDFRSSPGIAELFQPFPDCAEVCGRPYQYCETAQKFVSNRQFQEIVTALVLSAAIDGGEVSPRLERLHRFVSAYIPQHTPVGRAMPCILRHAVRWYSKYFGRLFDWPLAQTHEFSSRLVPILSAADQGVEENRRLGDFRRFCADLGRISRRPFPACDLVCPEGRCLFRYQVGLLLRDPGLTELFDIGMGAAVGSERWNDHRALRRVEERLANSSLPADAVRSLVLCYGVQQIAFKPGLLETARTMATDSLIEGYDLQNVDVSDETPPSDTPPDPGALRSWEV